MNDFEYYSPQSLKEACSLLDRHKGEARVLAGGTDLIVQMKGGMVRPAVIVDAKSIPELNRLEYKDDGSLYIGAAVSLGNIVALPAVGEKFGLLHQACSSVGSVQVRNRGTLGGNICNAAPSADTAPPLLCLDAEAMVAKSGKTRSLPMSDFFRGPGQTALAPNELLVGVKVAAPPDLSAGYFVRLTPREEMDISVVSVAALLVLDKPKGTCRSARIALGAVAATPLRAPAAEAALAGKPLTEAAIAEATEKAAAAASPITDFRGSAEYRLEMVRVLAERALKKCRDGLLD